MSVMPGEIAMSKIVKPKDAMCDGELCEAFSNVAESEAESCDVIRQT